MSEDLFSASAKRIADGNFSIMDLIGAAEALRKTGEMNQVVQLYHLWIQANPNDNFLQVALFNAAVVQSDIGDLQGAKVNLERAIARNPDFYPPYINLGTALERMGAAGEAVNQWTALANRLPSITGENVNFKLTALKQVARVLENNLLLPNAEHLLKQSLLIDSRQLDVAQHFTALRLAQCEWPIVVPWENASRKTLMNGVGPLSMAIYTDDPMLQLASATNYCRNSIGYPTLDLESEHQSRRTEPKEGRLRVGYISSDLRHHAVGFIMAEMFELHDRERYEIFAYYCGIPQEDPLKERIRGSVEHWLDIRSMGDEAVARRILADKIDILIDVNGYTKDARTTVFGMRPAPIIVNWLGFPGSMGTPYHHYIIADEWIIPPESEHYYSEKVLRLPCYQPNDRKRPIAPTKPTRASVGLPENAFVFCSFNGCQKISRFTFDRWMRILQGVPNSVLWLLEGAEAINQRLRDAAVARGVSADRIIFAAKAQNAHHLARYPLADLFLDSTPYGAHVTASDALWMGVPILTFAGRGFASRVCSGLVRAAGLPELVCDGPEDFVSRGIELGHNKAEVERLKNKLLAKRDSCTLFNMNLLVEKLEGLFEHMWKEYRADRLPRPNLANLQTYLEIGSEIDHDATEMISIKDYEGFYRDALAKRHYYAYMAPDPRLWSEEVMEQYESKWASSGNESSASVIPLLRKKKR